MEKDTNITKVVFRKFKGTNDCTKGEIIALFPEELEIGFTILSYMHLGQHANADYNWIIQNSKPANEIEYAALKSELDDMGYNLKIYKKLRPDFSNRTYFTNMVK